MELILKIILFAHVGAGAVTLISGPFAIFYNFKSPKNHKIAGRVFYFAMLLSCASSILGFVKRPEMVFYQFLLGIAVLVWAGMMRGVRAVMLMKGGDVRRFDWMYTIALGLAGLIMLIKALMLFQSGANIALIILFSVFGAAAVKDAFRNWEIFSNPQKFGKLDWMELHLGSMLGSFIASTTAFTVNAATFLPWYAQWFGPTLLLVPVIVYFNRKVRSMKRVSA